MLAKSNFFTHLALGECYFWTLCYRILWLEKNLHPDNRSITYKCRLAHIHFTTRAILVKLLIWEPKHLTGVYISRRVYRSHRLTCHLFIYIFNVTTCPSGIVVSQFPQWEDQTVGSGSFEHWPLLGSQEAVLCVLDRQMLSAAEGTGAWREGHSGPKSSICFYQLLLNACEEPLHPYLSLSLAFSAFLDLF